MKYSKLSDLGGFHEVNLSGFRLPYTWATPIEKVHGTVGLGKNSFKCCKMFENQDI